MVKKKQSAKKSTAAPTKKSVPTPKITVAKKSVMVADKKSAATSKKLVAKKAVPVVKKPIAKKATTVPPKSAAKKVPAKKKNLDDTGILVEAALNIEAGARTVSKYASDVVKDVADRTSQVAEEVIKKTKKGIRDVYDIGGKAVEDLQNSAQEYIDRFNNSADMKKAGAARQKLVTNFGNLVFAKYQDKKFKNENLFGEEQLVNLIKEIQTVDKKIVELGKKLENK
jgi:hypothetical protein